MWNNSDFSKEKEIIAMYSIHGNVKESRLVLFYQVSS